MRIGMPLQVGNTADDIADELGDLERAGLEAAAALPAELVERISLIGPAGYVRDRIAAFAAAGVTTLNVTPIAPDAAGRVTLIEQIRAIAD